MADYYSILNKTIAGLNTNSDEARSIVYGKARTAIEKQLRAMVPSPGDTAIDGQMKLLEEAIEKVEAEHNDIAGALSELETALSQVEEDSPSQEPAVTPVEEPMAETLQSDEPVMQAEPEVSLSGIATSETVKADVPASITELAPEPSVVVPVDPAPKLSGDSYSDKKPGGILRVLGRLIPYVFILAILAGGLYALWLNKDALLETVNEIGQEKTQTSDAGTNASDPANADSSNTENEVAATEPETSPEPEPEPEIVPEQVKEPVRLGSDGEDVTAEPADTENSQADTQSQEATTEVPLVLEPEPDPQSEVTPSEPIVQPVEEAVTNADETNNNGVGDNQPASQSDIVIKTSETAYLYEEGAAGTGASRTNASVVWTLVNESPEAGLPPEPVIQGKLNVPEKALTMILKIRRNTDDALPASHIIELLFSTPDNFAGGEIDNVARFVLKPTESARGEGLVAVPARIDAGYFLIALNNLEQAIQTNTKLLLDSSWIDIPLGYTTGSRALVTFEKGEEGVRVFEQAFADWNNR